MSEVEEAVRDIYAGFGADAAARLGWQPIETAPRDGSFFVTCNAQFADEYEVGCYKPYFWRSYEEVGEGLFRQKREMVREFTHDNFQRATHWFRLPPMEPTA